MTSAHRRRWGGRSALIGLSGGVDSAVAAWLLLEEGFRVKAVTLDLLAGAGSGSAEAARSQDIVAGARAVAQRLGIEHTVIDAKHVFKQYVVDYFVDAYGGGRTPNPCVKCNSRLRFALFHRVARDLGVDRIATGHYARLLGDHAGLSRATDRAKDQSYVLAEVSPALLREVLFPLGELTKETVRRISQDAGLGGTVLEESREICFIPDDDYRAFLRSRLGYRPGPIVDASGETLGEHSGTYNYTVGQRKGLGHAQGRPLYVASIDAERRVVVAGPEPAGSVGSVVISDPVIHRSKIVSGNKVQLRAMGEAVPARVASEELLLLQEPATGVAPGQTAVVYADDDVVMAGTIVSTSPWAAQEGYS